MRDPRIPSTPTPYQIPKIWEESYFNGLGRLCQGIETSKKGLKKQQVSETETFKDIRYEDVTAKRIK